MGFNWTEFEVLSSIPYIGSPAIRTTNLTQVVVVVVVVVVVGGGGGGGGEEERWVNGE